MKKNQLYFDSYESAGLSQSHRNDRPFESTGQCQFQKFFQWLEAVVLVSNVKPLSHVGCSDLELL